MSQWTMERAIGDLSSEICLPSNPYANLSQRATLRCQANALTAMLPELAKSQSSIPYGAVDLQEGFFLLRAQAETSSPMTKPEYVALQSFFLREGQLLADGSRYCITKWARLRIPTGQITWSAWKESKGSKKTYTFPEK